MRFLFLLTVLSVCFACTGKNKTDAPDPNSAILVVRNDDGTVSQEYINLEQNDLFLNHPSSNDTNVQLTILTESPGTTLGDASAANKLLVSIAGEALVTEKNYNYFWIIRSKGLSFNALSLIPKNVPTLLIEDWGALRKPKMRESLAASTMFLAFPTFHYLNHSDVDFLSSFSTDYVRCTEYDFMELQDISHPHLPVLKTGFCPTCLGIFIDKPLPSPDPLETITDTDAHLKQFLDRINSSEVGINADNLYFAYFNREYNNELKNSWTNLVNFASLVSLKGMLEAINKGKNLNLNIVLPASKAQFEQIKSKLNSIAFSEHASLQNLRNMLENTSIKYYKLDPHQLDKNPQVSSQHVIRIINPFPLTKNSMLAMLAASNPFAGLTGDQTLSEGIQYSKIPFYQIMHWKENLHKNFAKFVYSQLGVSSSLGNFIKSFSASHSADIEFLLKQAESISQNQVYWAGEMRKISDHIYKHKNLQKNLPPQIINLLKQDPN